jgi:hypothetical protein
MTGMSEIDNDYVPEPPLGVFTIEIAAPGGSSADWRPFLAQEAPLAECARQIVERFDLKAEVIELTTDRELDISRPGIILIDPRFMASPGGRAMLEAAAVGLPKWILPMLIVDQPGDARTESLADQVQDIFAASGALRARSARRGARGVSSFRAFSLLVRDMVFEAERQYIAERCRQRYGASVPSSRSSSGSGSPTPSQPGRFASAPDTWGETPDAR